MRTVAVKVRSSDGTVVETVNVEMDDEAANRYDVLDAARAALANNRAYVALATPTAAQTTAEVKALARQNNGVIRLLLGLLDGTD